MREVEADCRQRLLFALRHVPSIFVAPHRRRIEVGLYHSFQYAYFVSSFARFFLFLGVFFL